MLYLYNYKKNNFYLIILTAFLIFLTISFRHTYLLNWVAFIPILIFINFFLNKDFKYENKIIINFCIILGLYFLYLFIDGRLFLWFDQFLGIGFTNYIVLGGAHDVGLFQKFEKLVFYFLRIIRHAIWPNSHGSNYFFTAIFFANLIFIFSLTYKFFFRNINEIKEKNKLLFILSLIGFCGSIQVIHTFEIGKFLNSSFTFLIIFIYILQLISNNLKNRYFKYLFLISIFTFCTPLIAPNIFSNGSLEFSKVIIRYPFHSNNFNFMLNTSSKELEYNFNNDLFLEPKNKMFKGKRLTQEYLDFYEDLERDICNYSAIYNFSFDRSIQYLCADQKIYIAGLYFKGVTKSITVQELSKKTIKNAILISHNKIPNLEIFKIYNVPRHYRYNLTDTHLQFFSDIIYIYKLR